MPLKPPPPPVPPPPYYGEGLTHQRLALLVFTVSLLVGTFAGALLGAM